MKHTPRHAKAPEPRRQRARRWFYIAAPWVALFVAGACAGAATAAAREAA